MKNLAIFTCVALMGTGCGASSSGEPVQLDFSAERDVLGGFEQDTGFLPAQSPAALRVRATASAGLTVRASALVEGGELTPISESGQLTVGASFQLEVSARLDAAGVDYEGVVDEFSYDVEEVTVAFDPFLLDAEVTATATLTSAEVARVPIPSVPGSTLIVEVTGGTIATRYSGVCAAVGDGAAQYTGRSVTDGTVELAGTIEISVPIIGSESFGPFTIDVPVPATTQDLDLGTLALDSGLPLEGFAPCDGSDSDTDADPTTTGNGSGTAPGTTGMPPTTGTDSDETADTTETADTAETEATTDSADTEIGESSSSGAAEGEVDCGDALDNDANGFIDCDDPNCAGSNECECLPGNCGTCSDEFACVECGQLVGGECTAHAAACLDDEVCNELASCVQGCDGGDQPCLDACAAASSDSAISLWNAAAMCFEDLCFSFADRDSRPLSF